MAWVVGGGTLCTKCAFVCFCVWAVCAELENEERRVQEAQRELAAAAARVARKPAAPSKKRQPKTQPKRQPKTQPEPKRQPKKQGRVPKAKNRNLYTRHLTGIVVTEVICGGGDSQIALRVSIKDSRKTKMMVHYLKESPKADREQVIGAIRQFMEECGDLSSHDSAVCERFIELLQT